MQQTSETWKALWAAGARLEAKAVIGDGEYTLMSAPIITRALAQDGLGIGGAVSATCQLSLLTSDAVPRAAAVRLQMRLTDGETASEWLPAGTYYVARRRRDPVNGVLTLECYDALLKANAIWTPSSGGWPRTMAAVADELAALLGVALDSRTEIRTGGAYAVPEPAGAETVRDALGRIAAANAGNWIVTPEGKLRLVPVASAADAATATADVAEVIAITGGIDVSASAEVTGVRYAASGGSVVLGDETGIVIDADVGAAIAGDLYDRLAGVVYQPFSLEGAVYDPAAELGDYVRAGANGEVASVLCAETAVLSGAFHGGISAPQAGELSDEYPYLDGASAKALTAARIYAAQAVSALDASLDQAGVLDRLTDGGAAQGIYMVDGQLYVNMSYARAGTLVLGGLNNQNGLLQVQDASGNVIGTWDNDGISLTRGAVVFNVANNANNTIKINGIDDVAAYRRALLIRYQYGNDDPIRTLLDRGVMQIETYDGAGESDIVTIRPGKIILNTGDADDTVQINLLGYSDYTAPGEQNPSFGEAKLFLYNDRMYMTLQDLNTYNDVTWFELNVANRTLALTGDASISGSLTLGTPLPISGGGTGANAAAGALGNLGGAPCVKLDNSLTWAAVYNAFAGHANQTVATFFAANPSLLTGGKVNAPVFGIASVSNKTNGNYDFICGNANGAYIYHWRVSGLTSAAATPTVGTVYRCEGTTF